MRTALTIAGSDSGAGAGIQADLKTFAAHGVYGTTAVTAVTAQNSLGVTMAEALPADLVTAQIEAVVSDFGPHAAKTGMLANAAIVEAVAAAVRDLEIPLLVVDPVMAAKSGDRLLDDEALGALKAELLEQAYLVTPNIPEAEALSGLEIRTEDDRREAARRIAGLGARSVVITGGHLPTDDITDLLLSGGAFEEFRMSRVPGRHTHGTGCTFSAAVTARLALGDQLRDAIVAAQQYVADAIRHAPGLGRGHGPMNHFHKWITALAVAVCLTMTAAPLQAQEPIAPDERLEGQEGTDALGAFVDSLKLLMLEHAVRISFQEKTRRELVGPFLSDYRRSVRVPSHWEDSDAWWVNYIGHPIHGAAAGYLWLDHDRGAPPEIGLSRRYWSSRAIAGAWISTYSLQFEFGPLSEASIGNVGLRPETTGWVDHVVTPVGGFGLMVAEDALDRFFVKWVEQHTRNRFFRASLRLLFNPSRTLSNSASGKLPWHREGRPLDWR
jgi:hydroxymethylpyrimidine/phosphomethylpyrimidine kinase